MVCPKFNAFFISKGGTHVFVKTLLPLHILYMLLKVENDGYLNGQSTYTASLHKLRNMIARTELNVRAMYFFSNVVFYIVVTKVLHMSTKHCVFT